MGDGKRLPSWLGSRGNGGVGRPGDRRGASGPQGRHGWPLGTSALRTIGELRAGPCGRRPGPGCRRSQPHRSPPCTELGGSAQVRDVGCVQGPRGRDCRCGMGAAGTGRGSGPIRVRFPPWRSRAEERSRFAGRAWGRFPWEVGAGGSAIGSDEFGAGVARIPHHCRALTAQTAAVGGLSAPGRALGCSMSQGSTPGAHQGSPPGWTAPRYEQETN